MAREVGRGDGPVTKSRNDLRRLTLLTLGITALAAIMRVVFVLLVLGSARAVLPDSRAELPAGPSVGRAGFLTNDSPGYIQPAQEVLLGNLRGAGTLERPPGYPLFLALWVVRPAGVLVAQALLGALITSATILLTYLVTGSLGFSGGAGLVSAASPTGIGVTGLIMADLLLAAAFSAGLLLLVGAAKTRNPRWLLFAGALFGLGILVKPVLIAWAPLSVLAAWMLAGVPSGRQSIR